MVTSLRLRCRHRKIDSMGRIVNFTVMNNMGEYSINAAIRGFSSRAIFDFTQVSVAMASIPLAQFIKRCSTKIIRSFLFVITLYFITFPEEF